MTLDENKTTFRFVYEEIFNKGNIDLFNELCAPNFVKHTQQPGVDYGIEGSKQSVVMLRKAFPDIMYTVEDVIAEGAKVVVRWSTQGTDKGDFMGIPPTNKQFRFSGIEIIRVVDGKAVEEWEELD